MQSIPLIFGVDVAKAELVVASHGRPGTCQVPNQATSIKAWLRHLPGGSTVAMEASGRYHQLLASLAHAAGMRVYVLNAADVYFYAKALGARGKTDRVDAQVIARYAAEHHEKLRAWVPAPQQYVHIDELLRRRALVVAKREALRQAFAGLADLRTAFNKLDAAFDSMLRAIDVTIQRAIAADAMLAAAQRRIAQVPGFGPLGSALLAVLLARIPFACADALVAYSGLDPRPRDSGQMRGRRRISKRGPAYLRKQWYLAGFSASRSKAAKPLYLALRAKGLSTTEAFLVLGRKLLRVAYSLWKSGSDFDVTRLNGAQPA